MMASTRACLLPESRQNVRLGCTARASHRHRRGFLTYSAALHLPVLVQTPLPIIHSASPKGGV